MKNQSKNTNLAIPQYEDLAANFSNALQVVDDIVLKDYINQLHNLEIVPLNIDDMDFFDSVRILKITNMVYAKDENITDKFTSVFNALSSLNCTVFIIMDSNGIKTDFYMGIKSTDEKRSTNVFRETLENSLKGQFPGIQTDNCYSDSIETLLSSLPESNVSIVSCIADNKNDDNRENQNFIQGLEKLALSMKGSKYTALILANSINRDQISMIRQGYETIYTQLSPFAKSQINYTENEGTNTSQTRSESISDSTNQSVSSSSTQGNSSTKGSSHSESVSKEDPAARILSGIGSAVTMIGTAFITTPVGLPAYVIGNVISGASQALRKTITSGTSDNESETVNNSKTSGMSEGISHSVSSSDSSTLGESYGSGRGNTLNFENKKIINILKRLDCQLDRIQNFENIGAWEGAAYFLSNEPQTAEIAATNYASLMRGDNSGIEASAVNTWPHYKKSEVHELSTYISHLQHPVFNYNNSARTIEVTPSSIIGSNELSLHMGLPRKSVCGFPVIEHTAFGEEVVQFNNEKDRPIINLGEIFNMGIVSKGNKVNLNRDSLTMHTFITGSTGSGKSNTIYGLLNQLKQSNIPFLIVEPAKGEYKNIFGQDKSVRILGTNPAYSELLRINPFKFPKGIHVLEHVDRLIEIFNVCWPMYAAMPAVLKDAVLQSYESCGWDLIRSKNNIDQNLFPTFQDLLTELITVIDRSSYDSEVKSNYKGSLETRIKSLTNGLNGLIFSSHEINNPELFDSNVIVDLSRVGSLETKSLIMGLLVLRLNEYRMVTTESMNSNLKHITVLEEAHNLLKRTSTEQSMENANLSGKSVEMLSNAIAEMRTYGEGFIIADQSPNLLDLSAIRNTNTKIIMRLPDEADRRLVGKSAALNEDQLSEIAKLPKGTAVIYQNDWLEPVLCKIDKFKGKEIPYHYSAREEVYECSDDKWLKRELLKLLIKGRVTEPLEIDIKRIEGEMPLANFPTKDKLLFNQLIQEYINTSSLEVWQDSAFKNLSALVSNLLKSKEYVESKLIESYEFGDLTDFLQDFLRTNHISISEISDLVTCQCLLKHYSTDNPENHNIYQEWYEDIIKNGLTHDTFL